MSIREYQMNVPNLAVYQYIVSLGCRIGSAAPIFQMAGDTGGRLAQAAKRRRPDGQNGLSHLSVAVFDTILRKADVVNTDVVLVRIAQLLESNKCFFVITTYKSLHAAVLEAILPVGTFAHGQSTPVGHNGAEIGVTQWLALSATGRAVDTGVSQPPAAAAPTAAPI
jgi:hypothetical protein